MIAGASGTSVSNVPGNDTRGAVYRGGVPVLGVWPWIYASVLPSERALLPPDSTQEQRVRLRNSYSLMLKKPELLSTSTEEGRRQLMHLPTQDLLRQLNVAMSPFDNFVTWTPADPRWSEVEDIGAGAQPRVPALHVESWHDLAVGEATRLFKYQQDLGIKDQYLIVGPGPHCTPALELKATENADSKTWGYNPSHFKYGDLEIGDARYQGVDWGYSKLYLDWFSYWLKGEENRLRQMPKVQLYVIGQGWISGDRWPLKQTRFTPYYLSALSAASGLDRTGSLSMSRPARTQQDSYVYDPGSPTPSLGIGDMDEGAYDQRPVEGRHDVLVYSTAPLDKPVTIAGPIETVLYVSSSAMDTDFMVRLVDVYPDGKAINLSEDAFRVRYRDGFNKKTLLERGKVYKITLPNMVTAVRFAKGHRIRLDISSSSFPLYERNLNTGGNNYDEASWVVADNTVHHGPAYPSHVVLPVLPE
jgi:putative CocE/NonD family hydrolase